MPSGAFAHVCLLVEDLDAAVEHWTAILEELDPGAVEERLVRYDDFEGGEDRLRWACFVSNQGAEVQLMQPAPDTPLGRRLAAYGEGVHHVCFTADDPDSALARLKEKGLDVTGVSQDESLPWQRWGFVLPGSAHGTLVEVARPYRAVDGRWESAS